MKPAPWTVLKAQDLQHLTSHYLSEGRRDDAWAIDEVVIEGTRLQARVRMRSYFVSSSDAGGFHLSIFSTLEFLSQLMIVYAHVWAGLERKVREGWMVESRTRSVRAIRQAEDIRVEMAVRTMRRRGENLYCVADFRVTDGAGGLFEVTLKGFLA